MVAAKTKKARFEVGEWVRPPLGEEPLEAQILEDLGNLGVNGERVLLVSVPLDEGDEVESMEYPVVEGDLLPAV